MTLAVWEAPRPPGCSTWCKPQPNERGGKSGHQAMWLWVGSLPVSWFFGIPFGGLAGAVFLSFTPSLPLLVAMVVVLAGMGLLARSALNY